VAGSGDKQDSDRPNVDPTKFFVLAVITNMTRPQESAAASGTAEESIAPPEKMIPAASTDARPPRRTITKKVANALTPKFTRAVHPQPPTTPQPEAAELDAPPSDISPSQSTPALQDTRPPGVSFPLTVAPSNDASTTSDARQPEDKQQNDELYRGRVLKCESILITYPSPNF